MSLTVTSLIGLTDTELEIVLESFVENNKSTFSFNYDTEQSISELFEYFLKQLNSPEMCHLHNLILSSMTLLVRDSMSMTSLENPLVVSTVVSLIFNKTTTLTAIKCAYNCSFQSTSVRDHFVRGDIECSMNIIDFVLSLEDCEELIFGLRLVGFWTSLPNFPLRLLAERLKAVVALTNRLSSKGDGVVESLRLLYNTTLHSTDEDGLVDVVKLMRRLLAKDSLVQYCMNVLINMPIGDIIGKNLVVDVPNVNNDMANKIYNNKNMSAVAQIVRHLVDKLDFVYRMEDNKKLDYPGMFLPVLQCIINLCRSSRDIRHYCRLLIIPYLKDEVVDLPQMGSSVRNRMCKLMQSPDSTVSKVAAYLMYVVCNYSADRLVKYTGYGNAAGILSYPMGDAVNQEEVDSNDDSEFSETEEYSKLSADINPVTGRYEPLRPIEMSEEQKEYEIEQIITAIDKLDRMGVIKPMKLDSNNQPQPISHVLELFDDSSKREHDK